MTCIDNSQTTGSLFTTLQPKDFITLSIAILAFLLSIMTFFRGRWERKMKNRPILYFVTQGIGQTKVGTVKYDEHEKEIIEENITERHHAGYQIYFRVFNSDLMLLNYTRLNSENLFVKAMNQKRELIKVNEDFRLMIEINFNNVSNKKRIYKIFILFKNIYNDQYFQKVTIVGGKNTELTRTIFSSKRYHFLRKIWNRIFFKKHIIYETDTVTQ